MKGRVLYWMSLACGLFPMIVGLGIFFTWWIARAFFAVALHRFEIYGFYWVLISVVIAVVGLICGIIVLIINWRINRVPAIKSLLVILFNIPVVLWVLVTQDDLDNRAYIKLVNLSREDLSKITFLDSAVQKEIGLLTKNGSTVFYYYPRYFDRPERSVPDIIPVRVMVMENERTHYLQLPPFYKGECGEVYIDSNFKMHSRNN